MIKFHKLIFIKIKQFQLLLFLFSTISLYSQNYSKLIIKDIYIKGNETTKEKIILRELEFNKGDTINFEKLHLILGKSRNNLMNISLFNFVEIESNIDSINKTNVDDIAYLDITITCKERWYIWPVPYLYFEERNFNDWWERKDISRLTYGAIIYKENFRGKREQLSIGLQTGFNDLASIKYTNPGIDKERSIGIEVSLNYSLENNINYRTINEKQEFIKLDDTYGIYRRNIILGATKRFGIYNSFNIITQYNNYTFSDTLFDLNPQYILPNNNNHIFFSIYLKYKSDYRDYIHYPLKGHFFDINFFKNGLGILNSESISTLGIKSSFRKYWQINKNLFFASGTKVRVKFDKDKSYFLSNRLGFDNDYIRGFERYVIDGQNFVILKTNLKYNIIPTRILKLNFIKTEKFNTIPYRFYLNIIGDAGYISDKFNPATSTLSNKLLYGYGIGIDFVTYYDRAYRIEFLRNSKKEFSFAIQFTAPI